MQLRAQTTARPLVARWFEVNTFCSDSTYRLSYVDPPRLANRPVAVESLVFIFEAEQRL